MTALTHFPVQTIDEDLGRSASGLVERPGFQRLVAIVCTGGVGAVCCVEASRLARNGRDWHHLIDLCALVGTLVIDGDGVYEPRSINDRLLLGLKGTMSEYELCLLRERSRAARDSKAKRGELRVGLPPGYCWDESGRIEMDPDQRVVDAVRLVFRKFRELGSARQVLLWTRLEEIRLPVMRSNARGWCVEWQPPAYHNVLSILQNPVYAGAYVFGRTENRTRLVDGRVLETSGHPRPREQWLVLLRDHHAPYVSWEEFEPNQEMLSENAHMKKRASRKSGRGGRALLSGLLRCARCGRMLRVLYGMRAGYAHRYQCKGDEMRSSLACIGIGGVRVDRAMSAQLIEAVAAQAIEAAAQAAERATKMSEDVRNTIGRDLPAVWNAPSASTRTRQRIVRILIQEVLVDLDDESRTAILTIHWTGGRHTEVRVARTNAMRTVVEEERPSAVDVLRTLGGQWSDRDLAVTMNRMRCKTEHGDSWTVVRVRELRERLGIPEYDPLVARPATVSADEAARRLSICVDSVHRLIREGALPATQLLPAAPWQIPLAALDSEAVRIGVRRIVARRPQNFEKLQGNKTPRLPGV